MIFHHCIFRLVLALPVLLLWQSSFAQPTVAATRKNRIDSLHSSSDVVAFIRKLGSEYETAVPFPIRRVDTQPVYKRLIDSFHSPSFEKADLDGNGYTDLIFNGCTKKNSRWGASRTLSLLILGFGNDSFLVKELPLENFEYSAARIIRLGTHPYIQTLRTFWSDKGLEYYNDTITLFSGMLIDKALPAKHSIKKIEFEASRGIELMCLLIRGDSARLTRSHQEGGLFSDSGGVRLAQLSPDIHKRLYDLLEWIDFPHLKTNYSAHATDEINGMLHITYDDNQTTEVDDYGMRGTYSLSELENILFNLPETQHWQNATPVKSRNIDSLYSDDEVLGLLRTLGDDYPYLDFEPQYRVNALHDYPQRITAFGAPRWEKADFDNNGHADLLFNGFST